MRKAIFLKLLQRHTYTCLSHQYGIYFAFAGLVIVLYSMFQFGEELLQWSQTQYDSVFSIYHDNIAGRTFQAALSAPIPIDIVYTWVNGSDPALLKQLSMLKHSMNSDNKQVNESKDDDIFHHCPHPDCFSLPCLVAHPSFGYQATVQTVETKVKELSGLKGIEHIKVSKGFVGDSRTNVTLLRFEDKQKLSESFKTIREKQYNHTFIPAFVTTAVYIQQSSSLKNAIVLKGVPDKMEPDELKEKLPDNIKVATDWIYVAGGQKLALVWISDTKLVDKILDPKENRTLSFFGIGSDMINILPARILVNLPEEVPGDLAKSRFEDNEELRYSLRSVEKFAPWVRKIFIVTNGQIPNWLNMENTRINVVTHEDIFVNKSHLPTFSSPAIESHIHRIPGLAKKFIYLNDDVLFGKEVWPDDFYTHSFGQKVYLTWPVPNCADGCSPSWIKDGFCDSACNVSQCSWDGGDCIGDNVRPGVGVVGGGFSYTPTQYCYSGCADSWLADKFCDQSCNKIECGFDAGDCGKTNYDKMYRIRFTMINDSMYEIPQGIKNAYIDLSKYFKKVVSAEYDKDKSIRTAAVSNKYNLTTFVYKSNGNFSNIRVTLTGYPLASNSYPKKGDTGSDKTVTINFNITAYPSMNTTVNITDLNKYEDDAGAGKTNNETIHDEKKDENDYFKIISFPEDMKHPKKFEHDTSQNVEMPLDIPKLFNISILPENTQHKLHELEMKLKSDILTQSGFEKSRAKLLAPFVDIIKVQPNLNESDEVKSSYEKGTEKHFEANKESPLNNAEEKYSLSKKLNEAVDLSELGHQRKKGDPGEMNLPADKYVQKGSQRKEVKSSNAGNPFYRFIKEKRNGSITQSKGAFSSRKLLWVDNVDEIMSRQPNKSKENTGFLPWEQIGIFDAAVKEMEEREKREQVMMQYKVDQYHRSGRRKPLDTFADSLRHVSNIFDKDFGYTQRKVPAHMPHFIDRDIMYELQARYPEQYDLTSSHKLRHSKDMQFAFSYNYYMMSVTESFNASDVFNSMDTDHSGVLSDREIRLLATRVHDLPLTLQELTTIEEKLKNCAWVLYGPKEEDDKTPKNITRLLSEIDQPTDHLEPWALEEQYYDREMPLVTEHLVLNCEFIMELINKSFTPKKKYKHEVMPEDEIIFKMIRTNVSTVVGQLDDIRKNPRKFICLNDNINHQDGKEADMVKSVLRDFYETFFPRESQFELPPDYRNRFLDVQTLVEWKTERDYVTWWLRFALSVLLFIMVISSIWEKYSSDWRLPRNIIRRKILSYFVFMRGDNKKTRKASNV